MTTTVSYYLPEFTQGTLGDDSGMKLKLSKPSDRSAVNGSGDALLWAGAGWLTAVVGETWAESLAASVEDADGLTPRAGWLGVGSTVVSDVRAALDSASVSAIRDGIPKVGETHRYTQVASAATTTDVSIGEAT